MNNDSRNRPEKVFLDTANSKHVILVAACAYDFYPKMSAFFDDLIIVISVLGRSGIWIPLDLRWDQLKDFSLPTISLGAT